LDSHRLEVGVVGGLELRRRDVTDRSVDPSGLNQSTYSRVAISTSSAVLHGRQRSMSSVLYRPIVDSARALS
jgi:hypothetical protein